MRAGKLACARLGAPGEEYGAMMTELQVNGFGPGFAFFVQSANFVAVDVDVPAHVDGSDDRREVVVHEDELAKSARHP